MTSDGSSPLNWNSTHLSGFQRQKIIGLLRQSTLRKRSGARKGRGDSASPFGFGAIVLGCERIANHWGGRSAERKSLLVSKMQSPQETNRESYEKLPLWWIWVYRQSYSKMLMRLQGNVCTNRMQRRRGTVPKTCCISFGNFVRHTNNRFPVFWFLFFRFERMGCSHCGFINLVFFICPNTLH